ncbi:MAG: manganese efflux pump MntP family protein [Acidaminococcaceae bacterium]|nr:manganese efflux pump MntP family protein [Acidaminococcaceae bacterium]MDD4721294.1 manganese efflux pump MntP family protein [Acidaminococcaceae bacterium]
MSDLTLLILAISLSMDAFAVSVCGGLSMPSQHRTKGGLIFGMWFGGFQALMPIIGYYIGTHFERLIASYDHWIAFGLLSYIGISMLLEAKDSGVYKCNITDNKRMLTLAVATSIDALAVGVSFVFLHVDIVKAAVSIGAATFIISFLGCVFGSKIGAGSRSKAEIAGGIVLIGLGCKILAEHLGFL